MKQLIKHSILSAIVFTIACGEPTEKRNSAADDEQNTLAEEAAAPLVKRTEKVYYPIPSPEQMFSFISDAGVEYSISLVHDVSKAAEYTDPAKKALNFGVYTADLAYAAAYQDIKTTIELYKVVKRLGAEMNIAEMMTSEMMEKMQANMQEPDSLAVIAGDAYYQAVDFLEANQQNGKLALMSLGGWVESLYITLNAVEEVKADSPTAQRIADQKITFGNLYTYLKKNESEVGVAKVIEDVKEIRAVFASLVEEKSVSSEGKDKEGKMVFGKGSKIKITEAQFKKLKEAINSFRVQIIA